MVRLHKNKISLKDIRTLLDYFNTNDNRVDNRPDVKSKHPQWDQDSWPQVIVKKILDQVLDKAYCVDEVIFNRSKISFGLHADSGRKDQQVYKAVLIPLEITDHSGTAFFDNYWYNTSAKFTRQQFDPMVYTVFNLNDEPVKVNLQDFLVSRDVKEFPDYTNDDIAQLINIRLNNVGYTKTDERISDYSEISGFTPGKLFDKKIHQEFLNHIPYDDLTGLTLDRIIPWTIGDVIVFDRHQLHCATSGHQYKIGITVFTDQA